MILDRRCALVNVLSDIDAAQTSIQEMAKSIASFTYSGEFSFSDGESMVEQSPLLSSTCLPNCGHLPQQNRG